MTPEQILKIPSRVLTQAQREFYFIEGYILLEKIIGNDWLQKLRDATDELVERSRKVAKSDAVWDLEPDHSPQSPRLRRVSAPVDQHPVYWDYVSNSIMATWSPTLWDRTSSSTTPSSTSSGRRAARR